MTTATRPQKKVRPTLQVRINHARNQNAIPASNPAEAQRMERALRALPGFRLDGRANLENHVGSIVSLSGGYLVTSSDGTLGGHRTNTVATKVFHYYLPFDQMDRPRHVGHRREAQANASPAEIDRFEDEVRSTPHSTFDQKPDPYLHAELRLRLGRGWVLWTDVALIGGVNSGGDGVFYIPDEAPNTAHRGFLIEAEQVDL